MSLAVDFGVGIAVETRSLGGSEGGSLRELLEFVSLLVEGSEDTDVKVDRLEGVVDPIVGEGGTRTRATCSSSTSCSVVPVDPVIVTFSMGMDF